MGRERKEWDGGGMKMERSERIEKRERKKKTKENEEDRKIEGVGVGKVKKEGEKRRGERAGVEVWEVGE